MSKNTRLILNCALVCLAFHAAIVLCALIGCGKCKADYILAFHGPNCMPCRQMTPTEDALKSIGYDIRRVELTNKPDDPNVKLAAYYHIYCWPTYVYVHSTPRGDFDSGAPHLIGWKTAGELARYCREPSVIGVTSAVRGAVRSLFSPLTTVSP